MNSIDCNDRIVSEAAELFRVYGTKAVTMDSLAQHLGISKRTIYEKFRDKNELLETVLTCMFRQQKEIMERLFASEENVFLAFFKHGKMMRDYFSNVNPIFKADLKKFHSDVIMKIRNSCGSQFENTLMFIHKGIEQGVIRSDINPDVVNRAIQGMARMLNDHEVFPPDMFTQKEIMHNVFLNYIRGIATAEGLKVLSEYTNEYE